MSKPRFQGNRWDLFYELVRTDFVMRYHNSVLGFIWVLLKPLLIFLIIASVFSLLFRSQDPNYHLNLLLGLLIYGYFSEGTLRGVTSLYDKSQVILKVNFPKVIAVYTSVTNSLISFLAGFLVFLGFLFWSKITVNLAGLGYFFLLILILSLLIFSLNLFTGIIYLKLRDFASLWEVVLQLVFWGMPIVYPLNILPVQVQRLIWLNPLTIIIEQSRAALISGEAYDLKRLIYLVAVTGILLLVGYLFFRKRIIKIAEDF